MWDHPRLEIKAVSPALAGRFFTAEPPGEVHILRFQVDVNLGGWSLSNMVQGCRGIPLLEEGPRAVGVL